MCGIPQTLGRGFVVILLQQTCSLGGVVTFLGLFTKADQFSWRVNMVSMSSLKIDEIDKSISSIQGLEVAKTRFQTFLRGKSVLFNWKCQIREFHAGVMERGEVVKRYCG